jgi:CDP-glucose 4,6-dehydratase
MASENSWRGRSVLVTGATGFLGSHLVDALISLGAAVVVLRRPATEASAGWLDRTSIVEGDIVDTALLLRALAEFRVQCVFHVAAFTQVGVARRQPAAAFASNVQGTWSMLEAVRRSPAVEQILIASSDKAYGEHPTLPYDETMPLLGQEPYDASKACAEIVARTYFASYGTPVAITRCANLYGPGDRNWRRLVPGTLRSILLGERPIIRSDGSLVRDYLFVRDAASAYVLLAEAMMSDSSLAGQAFNFSAELPLSVMEMVQRLQAAAGTDLAPIVTAEAVGEIPAQYLSARKSREVLGWVPAVTLEQGLAETVDYYRELLGADRAESGLRVPGMQLR